jgi:hypothetical protein
MSYWCIFMLIFRFRFGSLISLDINFSNWDLQLSNIYRNRRGPLLFLYRCRSVAGSPDRCREWESNPGLPYSIWATPYPTWIKYSCKNHSPRSQLWTWAGSYGDGFTYATGHGFSLLGHWSRGSLHADTWAEIRHPHLATGWASVLSWGGNIRSRPGLPPLASKTARLGEEQLYYVVAHHAQVGVPRKNMSTEQWD